MIKVHNLTVAYGDTSVLTNVDFTVPEGDMCLVVGPTGSGKTTLLRAISAQVPHLSGGVMAGEITVANRSTRTHLPRDLADVLGFVAQDPTASFVTDTVEEELAFTMEQLGIDRGLMRRRVEDVLDLLGIAELRTRGLHTLSGGQAQRVAIGAVLTAQPQVLVLDEPTSALDPVAAEEVLAALSRLVVDSGLTVVLAEHRLERVVQFCDHVVSLDACGGATTGTPHEVLAQGSIRPPIAELGVVAGLNPVPLTVREARRGLATLRQDLAAITPPPGRQPGEATLRARGLTVTYGDVTALNGVDIDVHAGETLGVVGRNGAGKSTLLWALAGAVKSHGKLTRPTHVALVPQNPGDLLFRMSVEAECQAAHPETCMGLLNRLHPGIDPTANPRDLSEGQRLSLALAVQLSSQPDILALDEPTRGLDYLAKQRLATILATLRDQGVGIVVASHDVEFLAQSADSVVQLGSGNVVAHGPAREMLTDSAFSAPQVARALAPIPLMTVSEVQAVLPHGQR